MRGEINSGRERDDEEANDNEQFCWRQFPLRLLRLAVDSQQMQIFC